MKNPTTASDTYSVSPETEYLVDPTDVEVPAGFKSVVPVVFACNENYAPYASVAIQSVLENAGPGRFYRVMPPTRASPFSLCWKTSGRAAFTAFMSCTRA